MYIFLDIDGCLNNKYDWRTPYTINKSCLLYFSKLCKAINKKYSPIKIVLISTWKEGFNKDNNSPQIQHLIDTLSIYGLTINDKTISVKGKTRQEEIEYYIRRNNIKDYIILDDDISLYNDISKINIYIVDYHTGFTEKDNKKILKTLKRSKI